MATSDDPRALEICERQTGVRADVSRNGGLVVAVEEGQLDRYVMALGQAGVAIRRLELLVSLLESMFFALTSETSTDSPTPSEVSERALASR